MKRALVLAPMILTLSGSALAADVVTKDLVRQQLRASQAHVIDVLDAIDFKLKVDQPLGPPIKMLYICGTDWLDKVPELPQVEFHRSRMQVELDSLTKRALQAFLTHRDMQQMREAYIDMWLDFALYQLKQRALSARATSRH